MSRIKLALAVVEDLKQLAGSLESLVRVMEKDEEVPATDEKPKEEPITIEKVRAVLAEKSQSGKQAEVRALISKYGASKLTEVEPIKYADLLAEAEAF